MPLPEVGETVPDFSLTDMRGVTYRLSEMVTRQPTLLAFFKKTCATSRLSLPFVERLHKLYPALQLLGISQDDEADTSTLIEQAGLTFPVVLDRDWKVSAEYDLFTVPSLFLLDQTGKLARVNLGWSTEQYNALSQDVAMLLNVAPATLVTADDKMPAHRPG